MAVLELEPEPAVHEGTVAAAAVVVAVVHPKDYWAVAAAGRRQLGKKRPTSAVAVVQSRWSFAGTAPVPVELV